jgi:hypothetical protein
MKLPLVKPARALRPLLAILVPVLAASGQQVRGAVVDSTTRTPIIGAVVETLDSAGTSISRGLTDERGAYSIGRAAGARRLRVVRMGYRPRDVAIGSMEGLEQRLDVAMLSVPTFLETVSATTAPNCPRRADSQRAFALMEQARAGLLATVVSREMSQPAIKILRYERTSDAGDSRALKQSVRIDSTEASATSFGAVRNARAFAEQGFVSDSAGMKLYFGPDAEVMLDPAFSAAYCFRVRNGRSAGEVGLGFSPAAMQNGRVDIDGTLWIDSVAKVVKEIAFDYVGVQSIRNLRPGGQIRFHAMPNGALFIDRWFFKMVDTRYDTATGSSGYGVERRYYYGRESGGEVAWARWPDGHSYKASLATVRLKVVDKFNDPVSRAIVRLTDTDYMGSPDSTGTIVFHDVLPGPYNVEMQDSSLATKHIIIKSRTRFVAERGSLLIRTVQAPPVYAFFKEACMGGRVGQWIEIAATDDQKHPVQVSWRLGEDLDGRFEHLLATGVTTRDGIFGYCRDVAGGVDLQVQMTRIADANHTIVVGLPAIGRSKPYTIVMPFRTVAGR